MNNPLVLLACPEAFREQAALMAFQISKDERDSDPNFYSVRLANIDSNQVTHYLASVPMIETDVANLPYLSAMFPGSFWSLSEDVDNLDLWLEDYGLKIYEEEE